MNTYNVSTAGRPKIAQKQSWKKKNRRFYHFLLALVGLCMTYGDWYMLRIENRYYVMMSFIGPTSLVIFGGAALFPSLFGLEKLRKPGLIQYLLIICAIAAGALNFIAMTQ